MTVLRCEDIRDSLEGIEDRIAYLGMLSVGDRVANDLQSTISEYAHLAMTAAHALQKDLQNATCLFVDEAADTLDTTTTSKTTNGGLGDTLTLGQGRTPRAREQASNLGCCHEESCGDA